MKYTKLGNTNLSISRICLGTMTWGQQNTQTESFEQMEYALSQGVNFWDTAEMYAFPRTPETYGKTEEIIGNWFQQSKKRDSIILASKCSPVGYIRNKPIISRENILEAVDGSLKRLKTDYIDLYQFHWPTNRPHYHFNLWWNFKPATSESKSQIIENIFETLQTCDELVKAGKIKYIGLSNDSVWGVNQFITIAEKYNLPRIQSLQNEYNLHRRRDETDIMETCALEDISYLAWSPLNMGVISGKYIKNQRPIESRMSNKFLSNQNLKDMLAYRLAVKDEVTLEYLRIAQKHNLDICQMALAFTIRKPYMSSSIIGATSIKQLKTNIDAINLELSDEVLADIEKVRRKYPVPF
ncbi:aldo/keto reductase [Candidatus Francisella endociliophora]|uniref:Aldo/keto reductase n=1 Tax=Candidatus Francisella endociliophora TaxID=653937 RepID=A0A097EME2_9GAMM|nr:aldo/keto reductase [Francisella sp. FSC1006]AIT08736.1 aldo/keto reductase [Francisella sp. FSC1006]